MLKKYFHITIILTSLAILLGHDIFPHCHSDIMHSAFEHHHSGDHHHGDEGEEESKSDKSDLMQIFSHFEHDDHGVTFLSVFNFNNTLSKELPVLTTLISDFIEYYQIPILVRQNSPPYNSEYCSSHPLLPSGLRAPPYFIV